MLILTQIVDCNDSVLGFFHEWISEFATQCEHVYVICLKDGKHNFPHNVTVHSLGKIYSSKRKVLHKIVNRIRYTFRFLLFVWRLRNQYDVVFVHMNPEYLVLGGVLWRLWNKKVGLWYVHSSVTWILRIATLLTNFVFTTSSESFRIKSPKVHNMGHGIPIKLFEMHDKLVSNEVRIITVGRISKTKRIYEMLLALDELHHRGVSFTFTIVGDTSTDADVAYLHFLNTEIAKRYYAIVNVGPLVYGDINSMLSHADIFLNLSATQSMDKAVLESMASGVPVVSSNRAFQKVLEPYNLFCYDNAPSTIAGAVEQYIKRNDKNEISTTLRLYVEKQHSLSRLIPAIIQIYK